MPVAITERVGIDYDEVGEGFPLVLIGGLGFGRWGWFRQVPALSRHFRVVTFDVKRERILRDGVGDLASDVVALMDYLGIGKAHVLGASLGGFVAQELALLRPDLIERLVLISTSYGGRGRETMSPSALSDMLGWGSFTPESSVRRGLEGGHVREIPGGASRRVRGDRPLPARRFAVAERVLRANASRGAFRHIRLRRGHNRPGARRPRRRRPLRAARQRRRPRPSPPGREAPRPRRGGASRLHRTLRRREPRGRQLPQTPEAPPPRGRGERLVRGTPRRVRRGRVADREEAVIPHKARRMSRFLNTGSGGKQGVETRRQCVRSSPSGGGAESPTESESGTPTPHSPERSDRMFRPGCEMGKREGRGSMPRDRLWIETRGKGSSL